jgi:septum formation inhibitor-activating ATPase MinD
MILNCSIAENNYYQDKIIKVWKTTEYLNSKERIHNLNNTTIETQSYQFVIVSNRAQIEKTEHKAIYQLKGSLILIDPIFEMVKNQTLVANIYIIHSNNTTIPKKATQKEKTNPINTNTTNPNYPSMPKGWY